MSNSNGPSLAIPEMVKHLALFPAVIMEGQPAHTEWVSVATVNKARPQDSFFDPAVNGLKLKR
jgi:hypothetical protein